MVDKDLDIDFYKVRFAGSLDLEQFVGQSLSEGDEVVFLVKGEVSSSARKLNKYDELTKTLVVSPTFATALESEELDRVRSALTSVQLDAPVEVVAIEQAVVSEVSPEECIDFDNTNYLFPVAKFEEEEVLTMFATEDDIASYKDEPLPFDTVPVEEATPDVVSESVQVKDEGPPVVKLQPHKRKAGGVINDPVLLDFLNQ